LSDDWVPSVGPRWEKFSLRVGEGDLARLPGLLEEREAAAVAMGEAARLEWERWFSEEVLFHHLAELCLDIQRQRRIPERWARWTAYLHYLQPFHFRRLVGTTLRAFLPTGKISSAGPERCPQE
jgi:hypothetical protein